MSVVVGVEEVGPNRKELKIEVPGPAVSAEVQKVAAEIRRSVQLPGFRHGKVPVSLVKERFREEIQKEVVDRLIPRFWSQAQDEAQLQTLVAPQVENVEYEAGSPMHFVVTVDVEPEIEVEDEHEFDLPDPETEPGEQEVEDFIENLRSATGNWEEVDRPAARGDKIKGEIFDLNEPEPEPKPDGDEAEAEDGADSEDSSAASGQPIEVELGDERVWEELTVSLTGLAAGQESEFTRTETAPPAEEGGEPVEMERKFRVTVGSVEEKELPEVNDEWVKSLGEYEDVAAMEESVRDRIRSGKVAEARRTREEALYEQLREKYPAEMPEGAVDLEVRRLVSDYAENLSRQGLDLQNAQLDWQEIGNQARPQAEQRVHVRVLLDKLARKSEVAVAETEVDEAITMMARMQNTQPGRLRADLEQDGRIDGLRDQIKRDKVVRMLLGETEADAESEEETETDTED